MQLPRRNVRGLIPLMLVTLAGCSDQSARREPDAIVRNEEAGIQARISAAETIWNQKRASTGADHEQARESIKRIAWQANYPSALRVRALELLADDAGEENQADTRNMFKLMLATEPSMEVIRFISARASHGRWQELTPALVRSYSRKTEPPPDLQRPERAALLAINPGQSIEQIAYGVFVAPVSGEGPALDRARRAKLAAWELLSRLDADGSRRAELLAADHSAADDATIADLRACAADLRCIPLTAPQLDWLTRLRDFSETPVGAANRAWWSEAKAVVGTIPSDRMAGWSLRNVEPVRWASSQRPQLLAMDRAALSRELQERLRGRPVAVRGDADRGGDESFAAWAGKLNWGDLLTLAVVEEAVGAPGLGAALAEQVTRDRVDTTTEYGGVIQWQPDGSGGRFVTVLYPPRPSQRQGDLQFVASDQMLSEGARALAHYHFHVQKDENREYAGPGPGDREYAENQGRACVVFTTLRTGVLNADYYQAGGVVVDLGEVKMK